MVQTFSTMLTVVIAVGAIDRSRCDLGGFCGHAPSVVFEAPGKCCGAKRQRTDT